MQPSESHGPRIASPRNRRAQGLPPFLLLIFLPAFALYPSPARAQGVPDAPAAEKNQLARREISFWAGGTVAHPHLLAGVATDPGGRKVTVTGIRFDQRLLNAWKISLRGNLGVTPAAVFQQPPTHGPNGVYGFGLSSGVEVTTRRVWAVQPLFDSGVGCLIFTNVVPVPGARRFNYMAYVGPGLRLPHQRMRFGVWYYHFSNWKTAVENPGVDFLVLYVAYSFYRK